MYPDIFESATFSILCRSGFRPHVFGESGIRIRNFLNPLSKEEIFEYVINPESCGRSFWITRLHLHLTGEERGKERPDGLGVETYDISD